MLLALPIMSLAMILLFSSFNNANSYLFRSVQSQSEVLGVYKKSQLLVSVLYGSSHNRTSLTGTLSSFAKENGLSITVLGLSDQGSCLGTVVCRIITVSGKSYLVVIKG